MGNWNIGINAEGNDTEKEALHKRGHDAAEYVNKILYDGLEKMLNERIKMGAAGYKKYRNENVQYIGAAIELIRMIEEVIPAAMKETADEVARRGDTLTEESQRAMKMMAVGEMIKQIVEGGDKLRRM